MAPEPATLRAKMAAESNMAILAAILLWTTWRYKYKLDVIFSLIDHGEKIEMFIFYDPVYPDPLNLQIQYGHHLKRDLAAYFEPDEIQM